MQPSAAPELTLAIDSDTMQPITLTPWLALILLSTASVAQEEPKPASLKRAQLTFAAIDSNHDRALSFEELAKAGLSRRSFKKFDADESQSWSEADFLLYYEHLLRAGGRNVGSDLLSEVARIRTRRDPSRSNKRTTRNRAASKQSTPVAKKSAEVVPAKETEGGVQARGSRSGPS